MKKLLFLCHGAGNGGAERVITTLAGAFAQKDYFVVLITTNEPKNDYVLNSNIIHKIILSNKKSVIYRTIDRIIQLRSYLKQYKPDCIISFSGIPNMQAVVADIGLKNRLIISERVDPSKYPQSKLGRILRDFIYHFADCIVFQTEDARNYFDRYIQNRSVIIPNPIRNDLPKPYMGERKKRIVGVGSLGEQKNWTMGIKASRIFFESHPDYVFDIYGDGPLKNILQKMIYDDDLLRDRVKLHGFVPDVVDRILNATMYISSSDYEGISNAMLESLAVGVPTICTDCPVGGARENIESGENGFLVPVGDYKKLAELMTYLADNKSLQQRFSQKSPSIREILQLDNIVYQWEKVINGDK